MLFCTPEEKSLLVGIVLSALVAGTGIYELYAATAMNSVAGYLGNMIVGAMLFNAGVCGVTAMCSIWYNYRAIL